MNDKEPFGGLFGDMFEVGDIVEWTTWNSEIERWKYNYGVLLSIQNEIRENRMVSISKVLPLQGIKNELEFFTLSLRKVNRSDVETEKFDI
jgi:hypothetical protein